jgi:hypothetical protein
VPRHAWTFRHLYSEVPIQLSRVCITLCSRDRSVYILSVVARASHGATIEFVWTSRHLSSCVEQGSGLWCIVSLARLCRCLCRVCRLCVVRLEEHEMVPLRSVYTPCFSCGSRGAHVDLVPPHTPYKTEGRGGA